MVREVEERAVVKEVEERAVVREERAVVREVVEKGVVREEGEMVEVLSAYVDMSLSEKERYVTRLLQSSRNVFSYGHTSNHAQWSILSYIRIARIYY